jgi:hypothetical protein
MAKRKVDIQTSQIERETERQYGEGSKYTHLHTSRIERGRQTEKEKKDRDKEKGGRKRGKSTQVGREKRIEKD